MHTPEDIGAPEALAQLQWHDRFDTNYIDRVGTYGVGAIGVGVIAASLAVELSASHPLTALATGAAAATSTLFYERRVQQRAQAQEAAALPVEAQVSQYLGRAIELYSARPKALPKRLIFDAHNTGFLRLYDVPLDSDTPTKSDQEVIERLKTLSQKSDFTHVVVDESMLKRTHVLEVPEAAEGLAIGKKLSSPLLLKKSFAAAEADSKKADLYAIPANQKTFDDWLQAASGYSDDKLREYMTVMKQAAPSRPLVRLISRLDPGDTAQRLKIKTALCRELEQGLESTITERPDPIYKADKRTLHITGTIHEEEKGTTPKVKLRDHYHRPVSTQQNVLEALEQNLQKLQRTVGSKHASPKDRLQAATTLAYLEAVKATKAPRTYPPKANLNKPLRMRQAVIAENRPRMWFNRYKKVGLTIILCSYASVGISVGGDATSLHNSLKDNTAIQATDDFLHSGVDPVIGLLPHEQPTPSDTIEGALAPDPRQQLPSNLTSRIGNAGTPSKTEVWSITSFGGMSTTGYWNQDVKNTLKEDMSEWVDNSTPFPAGKNPEDIAILPSIGKLALDVPRLVVGRQLKPSDAASDWYQVPVPVLQDTEVVAATVTAPNGAILPTFKRTTQEGSTILFVEAPDSNAEAPELAFSYTLGRSPLIATRPHKTSSVVLEELTDEGEVINIGKGPALRPVRPLDGIWKEVTGSEVATTKDDQAQLNNFYYDLNPINADKVQAGFDDEEDFARTVLEGKRAQCNVANTLQVISHPNELNYAVGFYNGTSPAGSGGTDEYRLSLNEAHAWAVDEAGTIVDATPQLSNGETSVQAESMDPSTLGAVSLGLLGVGAAGVAVLSFMELKQRAKNQKAKLKAISLNKFNMTTLHHAYELLDTLVYASDTEDQSLTGRHIIDAQDAHALYKARQMALPTKYDLLNQLELAEREGRLDEVPPEVLFAARTLAR